MNLIDTLLLISLIIYLAWYTYDLHKTMREIKELELQHKELENELAGRCHKLTN